MPLQGEAARALAVVELFGRGPARTESRLGRPVEMLRDDRADAFCRASDAVIVGRR